MPINLTISFCCRMQLCKRAHLPETQFWRTAFTFDTIANMPGTYTIRTDPALTPVQHALWKIPIEYCEQIEKALDEMVLKGVIAPVSGLTTWVSLLTYPHKLDGSLCICLDPRTLMWEHYKAPTLDEISHHLSRATCFSKLDAKDGFWSIHLDEDLSYLTTFNTHHGRYRFLCMPFGLKMSQDVFQMWMDQATDHSPNIIAIHDDICIIGHTPEEYVEPLLCLMHSAKDHGIISNSAKCHIRQPQIVFYGEVFIAQGMQPDPSKIQALQDLPTPNLQTKLQSFLGLIYCPQPFIPGFSTKTAFLWEQLAMWDWNPSIDAAFQHLKAWICQTLLKAILVYYDQ